MTSEAYRSFWRGKRVLVTGHTGFKGTWLTLWLQGLGAEVTGISLPPDTIPSLFEAVGSRGVSASHFVDIRNRAELTSCIRAAKPEIVFHLAAQPLVRKSYINPIETMETNVMGTVNVLNALLDLDSVSVVVAITTDKVYRNQNKSRPFREDDALGGHDPYSASKASAELVIASFRDSFFRDKNVAVASTRAGNVIGGGDWSADRLIPDAVRAWGNDQVLHVRNPSAVRPWQHVLEPLNGYLRLAYQLWSKLELAESYNIGPNPNETFSVREVLSHAKRGYRSGRIFWGCDTGAPHEEEWLMVDITRSRDVLGIKPRWTLLEAIDRTMHWYRQHKEGFDARDLCEADISAYEGVGLRNSVG